MNKSYKPGHIILFILACLLILGSVVLLVPTGKVSVAGVSFRFLSEKKLLQGKQKVQLSLDKIITGIDTTALVVADSTNRSDSLVKNFTIKKDNTLDYNKNGERALVQFFRKLTHSNKHKVRVLHFGDSQIEGDRMTAFIRERMQEKFGGKGPGFIPAVNRYGTVSYLVKQSDNWVRYTNFRGKKMSHSDAYGIMNSAGRFTEATTLSDDANLDTAWISIAPGEKTYPRTKAYTEVNLYYTDARYPCAVNIYQNNLLIRHDSLFTDGNYHIDSLSFKQSPGLLKFEFIANVSPTILGFSLDGKTGVQVDNIAMRGSSGLFLEHTDKKLFQTMVNEEDVQLFIMQFGGNAIPYIKDSAQACGVVNYFQKQLYTLKRLRPSAAIIVIGPSDMSQINEGDFTTYPLLPYYISQLKKAVITAGAAYFNTYQAMGGKNSMVVWYKHDLASKDHVHFTRKGAKIVAQQFYNALMKAYTNWKAHEK